MKRAIGRTVRTAAAVIGAVLVLAVVALAIVIATVDPNGYKPRLIALAATNGVDLEIPGALAWSLVPRPAVEVGAMRVVDRRQRIAPARIAGARLELRWLSLLRGKLAIDSIAIDGLEIALRTAAMAAVAPVSGKAHSASARPQPPVTLEEMPPEEQKRLALAIENFSASNSRVTLDGGDGGAVLEQVEMRGSGFNLDGRPFPLRITFAYRDPRLPAVIGNPLPVFFKTRVSADAERRTLMLTEAQVTLAPVARPPLHGHFELTFDAEREELFVDELGIAHGDARAEGQLRLQRLSRQPRLQGQLSAPPFNLRELLRAWDLDLDGKTDPAAFTRVGFGIHLNATAPAGTLAQIGLDAIDVALDDSHLRGTLALGLASPRQLQLELNGDQLPLDRYAAGGGTGTGAATALFAPVVGALAWLEGGNGSVQTRWQSITGRGLRLDDVHLAATAVGRQVDVADLSARLLSGSASASGQIRLDAIPNADFKAQLNAVALGQAAAAMATDVDLDGRLDLSLTGTTQGTTGADLRQNLHANGALRIVEPVLKTINLERSYCELTALLGGDGSAREWPADTALADLTGDLRVSGATIALDGYRTGIGNLGIRGDGIVDTAERRFDFLLITRLGANTTSANGCRINSKRLLNRDIPLRCQGAFATASAGSCRPDGKVLEALLQEKLLDGINGKKGGKARAPALEQLMRGLLERKDP